MMELVETLALHVCISCMCCSVMGHILFPLPCLFLLREEDKNIFDFCRENNIDHVTKAIRSKKVDVNTKDEKVLGWGGINQS